MTQDSSDGPTYKSVWRFLLPSVTGAFIFLFPLKHDQKITIPLGYLSDTLRELLAAHMSKIVLAVCLVSVTLTLFFSWRHRRDTAPPTGLVSIFVVGPGWLVLRGLGLAFAILIFFQMGPEYIWSEFTGGVVLNDLAKPIFTIFLFAGLLLPLLTDYGLMELLGTLLSKIFRRLFTLPGRASIDALASWMAAAPVGVLITSQQYENGYYSGREAAVIATNFSVVSLPFCLIVAQTAGLDALFVEYYLTVVLAGIVAAIIMPRTWPLSKKTDTYCGKKQKQIETTSNNNESLWSVGLQKAITRAHAGPDLKRFVTTGIKNVFDIWFGLMPPMMAIATMGLMINEFTQIMTWASYPFVFLLELFQIPESTESAPALLVGFLDMFLPAVIAQSLDTELTKFVVIGVSITQLIYMSEVGILLLKTRIPLSFLDLCSIFLIRTLITLPIFALVGHWLLG